MNRMELICNSIEAISLTMPTLNKRQCSGMFISVEFDSYDYSLSRRYYNGIGNQHGHTYYVEEGVWYLKSMGMNLGTPLKDGLNIKIWGTLDELVTYQGSK
jgi:hypothetical protein